MGLGDIKLNSYLDQTFSGDIELIDVGNVPISGIKASLASLQDYERLGLERAFALTLLTFTVENHPNGKAFVKVRSIDKITEPFMQLLVDLVWATGQVNRSYTVLLDPPNYQYSVVKKQLNNIVKQQSGEKISNSNTVVHDKISYSHVEKTTLSKSMEHRGVVAYGPTLANETIWQIAQHYKTGDTLLQQIILAIVGTNSNAFTEGNLNGLKEGSQLQIPTNNTISNVPAALAKIEVLAHDKAWQTRQPIEHMLLPPYINAVAPVILNPESKANELKPSEIPSITLGTNNGSVNYLPLTSSLLSIGSNSNLDGSPSNARMDIVAAAIATVREANLLLTEELHSLQNDKKLLQQKLVESEQEMKRLRAKISLLLKRHGLGQVGQKIETETNSIQPWALISLILILAGFAYWWFWIRARIISAEKSIRNETPPSLEPVASSSIQETSEDTASKATEIPSVMQSEEEPSRIKTEEQKDSVIEEESPVADNTVSPEETLSPMAEKSVSDMPIEFSETPAPLSIEEEPSAIAVEEQPASADEHVFEYTPGAQSQPELAPIEDKEFSEKIKKSKSEAKSVTENANDNSIDFVLNPVEEVPSPVVEKIPPVKSKAALETLLALAKTYIGMDDLDSAKQSLQEVIEFGNDKQKLEAARLMDELEKK